MTDSGEKIYYSASARGFYHSVLHRGKVPDDAMEVTRERWRELLDAQSTGHEIAPDPEGRPRAVKRVKTADHYRADLLVGRAAALTRTQDLVERHRDEIDMGLGTTLTAAQYAELLQHRHALRQIHEHQDYASDEKVAALKLPSAPGFIEFQK